MSVSDSTAQLRRGALVPIVLATLEGRPTYGLRVLKRIRTADEVLGTPEGTVYPLLNRLERASLISSDWTTRDDHRPRRYYTLTDMGQRELDQFREEWPEFRRALDTLLSPTGQPTGDR